MADPSPTKESAVQRRRSTRIVHSVPLTVSGTDEYGQRFKERTSTLIINCHGCKYLSKHEVPKRSLVSLEISRAEAKRTPRLVLGRVSYVQRPRTGRELFQIGIQFDTPGNVWDIAFPPADWFPPPGETTTELPRPIAMIPSPAEAGAQEKQEAMSEPARETAATVTPDAPGASAAPLASAAPAGSASEDKIHILEGPDDSPMAMARQVARLVAEAKSSLHATLHEEAQRAVQEASRDARARLESELRASVAAAVREALAREAENARRQFDAQVLSTLETVKAQAAETSVSVAQAPAAPAESAEFDRQSIEAARQALERSAALAEDSAAQMESIAEATMNDTRTRLSHLFAEQSAVLEARIRALIADRFRDLEPALDARAQVALDNLAARAAQTLAPHLDRADRAATELASAGRQAAESLEDWRARMAAAAEESLRDSLEHLRQQTAQFPAEFERGCREALAKFDRELEEKGTDATHATFESLYKASEWYQKKAQTSMQAAMERGVEQAAHSLEERAGEASRLFATELEHYSRSYVEHAQGLIEESMRDNTERARNQFNMSAETTAAAFADRLHRAASDTLARFEQASQTSNERAHAQAVEEFARLLNERTEHSLSRARQNLEAQHGALLEVSRAEQESQRREWLGKVDALTGEAVENFKSRLENASNSWLAASAATLAQQSQAVIETLAEAAEVRLRDTCSKVFAGLGETLRQRLLGISSELAPDSSSAPPQEKK